MPSIRPERTPTFRKMHEGYLPAVVAQFGTVLVSTAKTAAVLHYYSLAVSVAPSREA